jgi:hypothetical protein
MGNVTRSGVSLWEQKNAQGDETGANFLSKLKQLQSPKILFRSLTKVRANPAFARAIYFTGGSLSFA